MELKHYGVKGMKWGVRNDVYEERNRIRSPSNISNLRTSASGAYRLNSGSSSEGSKRIDQRSFSLTKKQKIIIGATAAAAIIGAGYATGVIPKGAGIVGKGLVSDFQKSVRFGQFALDNIPGVKQAMNLKIKTRSFKNYVLGKKAKVDRFINNTKRNAEWIKKGYDIHRDVSKKAYETYDKYAPEVKKKVGTFYNEHAPIAEKYISDVSTGAKKKYNEASTYYKAHKKEWTSNSKRRTKEFLNDADAYTQDLLSRNNRKLRELGF